jgi:multiple sugar transport system ATP-binding protein
VYVTHDQIEAMTLATRIAVAHYSGDDVVLGLRPEAITDGARVERSASVQFLENRIELVEPAGSDTFVISRMGGTDVVAR